MQFMKTAHAIRTVDTAQSDTSPNKMYAFAFFSVGGNKEKAKYELSASMFDSALLVYSRLKCNSAQY
jgi:hypothetical protein